MYLKYKYTIHYNTIIQGMLEFGCWKSWSQHLSSPDLDILSMCQGHLHVFNTPNTIKNYIPSALAVITHIHIYIYNIYMHVFLIIWSNPVIYLDHAVQPKYMEYDSGCWYTYPSEK